MASMWDGIILLGMKRLIIYLSIILCGLFCLYAAGGSDSLLESSRDLLEKV